MPLYASILIIFSFSRFNRSLSETLERLEEERATVAHMANHDPLTGLPNMRIMEIRAKQAFAMAKRGQARPALFIDLDHFKPVNDELGRDVGDMLLKEASARMRTMLREGDSLVRSGGDEFLVLLTHFNDEGDVLSVAEKIRNAVVRPFKLGVAECSIGIAFYPDGDDLQSLSRLADNAMYGVKRSGKNGIRIWRNEDAEVLPDYSRAEG